MKHRRVSTSPVHKTARQDPRCRPCAALEYDILDSPTFPLAAEALSAPSRKSRLSIGVKTGGIAVVLATKALQSARLVSNVKLC
jgi:hypothetical protein